MKFVHAGAVSAIERTVNIIDGPKIAHPDSSVKGKEIELIRVTVRYVWSNGHRYTSAKGNWAVDSFSGGALRITAEGWTLKQDGGRSHRFWKGAIPTSPSRTENGWLKKLIDGMRPIGKPDLPFDVTEA